MSSRTRIVIASAHPHVLQTVHRAIVATNCGSSGAIGRINGAIASPTDPTACLESESDSYFALKNP